MTDQFFTDKKSQEQLKKFYKTAPKAFRKVSAGVLSSMAVESRTNMQKTLRKDFTIRTPTLLNKGLRFTLANKNEPINQQQSTAGSIDIPRHDDWEGAQTGKASRVTMFTDKGRVGNSQAGKARKMSKAGRHTTMSDFKLKGSGDNRTNLYLQAIGSDDKRRRKPFYLPRKYKGMRKGVYKFSGGRKGVFRGRKGSLVGAKIVRLSTPQDKMQPKRTNWMGRAVRITTRPSRIKSMWVDNFDRELKKVMIK